MAQGLEKKRSPMQRLRKRWGCRCSPNTTPAADRAAAPHQLCSAMRQSSAAVTRHSLRGSHHPCRHRFACRAGDSTCSQKRSQCSSGAALGSRIIARLTPLHDTARGSDDMCTGRGQASVASTVRGLCKTCLVERTQSLRPTQAVPKGSKWRACNDCLAHHLLEQCLHAQHSSSST